MSAAIKVQRLDLPAWWCWWVGTLEAPAEGISALGEGTPPWVADCGESEPVVTSTGNMQQSWLQRGAPGLSARHRKISAPHAVIPAQAGMQLLRASLDASFRRHQGKLSVSVATATGYRCCEGGES